MKWCWRLRTRRNIRAGRLLRLEFFRHYTFCGPMSRVVMIMVGPLWIQEKPETERIRQLRGSKADTRVCEFTSIFVYLWRPLRHTHSPGPDNNQQTGESRGLAGEISGRRGFVCDRMPRAAKERQFKGQCPLPRDVEASYWILHHAEELRWDGWQRVRPFNRSMDRSTCWVCISLHYYCQADGIFFVRIRTDPFNGSIRRIQAGEWGT